MSQVGENWKFSDRASAIEGFVSCQGSVVLSARVYGSFSACGRHAGQGTDHGFPRGWTIDMRPRVRSGLESTEWIRSSEPQVDENSLHGTEMINSLERSG